VDIDKYLFNSLHRLIALIEPGAGSNFERPLLAQSRHKLSTSVKCQKADHAPQQTTWCHFRR
jgi:hypothetical protein